MRSSMNKGMALVITIMSLLFIGVLLSTVLSVTTSSHRGMVSRYNAIRSYYLAREGLSRAMAELSGNPNYAVGAPVTATLANDAQGRPQGSYTVNTVTSGNTPGNTLRAWVVTSTGNFGTAVRTIRAWVGQESFSNYAYFSNREMSGDYWITGNTMQGPVHTNGHFNFSGTPAFSDQTTSSNTDEAAHPARSGYPFDNVLITYDPRLIQGNDHSSHTTFTDPTKFYHAYDGDYTHSMPVATTGAQGFSFTGGQPGVTMPTSNSTTAGQATTTFTRDATLVFSVSGNTGRVSITTTDSHGHSSTTTRNLNNPDVFAATNANLYVKGEVHGNVTVTASGSSPTTHDPYDVDTYRINSTSGYGQGNVFLTGDLSYHSSTSDVFGIVAQNNIVIKPDSSHHGNMDLVGSYMALNGIFMAHQFDSTPYNGNQMTLTGGLTSLSQTLLGTFTVGRHNQISIVTGYNENYVYDTRLANMPPPAFPVTGRVNLKGLVDTGALGSI